MNIFPFTTNTKFHTQSLKFDIINIILSKLNYGIYKFETGQI